jgi:hypothetical protein
VVRPAPEFTPQTELGFETYPFLGIRLNFTSNVTLFIASDARGTERRDTGFIVLVAPSVGAMKSTSLVFAKR